MTRFTYLAVLAGCLASALWLEPVLRVGVLRRWRRLLLALLPVAAVFVAWDLAAIAAGHWTFDRAQVSGVWLPGGLPLDELLFFVVVPVCAVLGFEAARRVLGWPAGDEPPAGDGRPAGDSPRDGGSPRVGGARPAGDSPRDGEARPEGRAGPAGGGRPEGGAGPAGGGRRAVP